MIENYEKITSKFNYKYRIIISIHCTFENEVTMKLGRESTNSRHVFAGGKQIFEKKNHQWWRENFQSKRDAKKPELLFKIE